MMATVELLAVLQELGEAVLALHLPPQPLERLYSPFPVAKRKDPKENIFELLARWLQNESKGTWLLVLDNLDDGAVFSTPQAATSKAQSGDGISQLRRPL